MRVIVAVVLLSSACPAAELTEVALGQAFWRPNAMLSEIKLPDGGSRIAQADFYGFALERPEQVCFTFRSEGLLAAVIKAVDQPDAKGDPSTAGVIGNGKTVTLDLAAGRYLAVVGAEPPDRGSYLLVLGRPIEPAGRLEAVPATGGEVPCLGRWRAPGAVSGCAVSPTGQHLATWGGDEAWLHDLATGASYRLPHDDGRPTRVAFSPDGWTVLTVTRAGAMLLALPTLTPVARFTAGTGLRDACYGSRRQRVAVLPSDAPAYVSSPVPGDLAYLAGSQGAEALVPDPAAELVGLRFGGEVAVYQATSRELLGRVRWPAAPVSLAMQPGQPVVIGAGPAATLTWKVGTDRQGRALPDAAAASLGPTGVIALALPGGVRLLKDDRATELQPAVAAAQLAFNAAGHRLLAVADGTLLLWDTTALLSRRVEPGTLTQARLAYQDGLNKMKSRDYAASHASFKRSRELLGGLPAEGETVEFLCLTLLRLSQVSYLLKDYQASLDEAGQFVATAGKLPEGALKEMNLAQAYYRRADALYELRRMDEARKDYREALAHGLEGPAAADARDKTKP